MSKSTVLRLLSVVRILVFDFSEKVWGCLNKWIQSYSSGTITPHSQIAQKPAAPTPILRMKILVVDFSGKCLICLNNLIPGYSTAMTTDLTRALLVFQAKLNFLVFNKKLLNYLDKWYWQKPMTTNATKPIHTPTAPGAISTMQLIC